MKHSIARTLVVIFGLSGEVARTLLFWCLVASIAFTTQGALAEPPRDGNPEAAAAARTQTTADIDRRAQQIQAALSNTSGTNGSPESVDQLTNAWSEVIANKLPAVKGLPSESPERKAVFDEANRLTERLYSRIEAELAPMHGEMLELANQSKASQQPVDQNKAVDLFKRIGPLSERLEAIQRVAGENGLKLPGVVQLDPNAPPSPDNVARASINVEEGSKEQLAANRPAMINQHRRGPIGTSVHAVGHLTSQYAVFSFASILIGLGHALTQNSGLIDTSDPRWIQNLEERIFDAVGYVGFGFFMMANHYTIRMYKPLREGKIPPNLVPAYMTYLGMTMGMLASSLFHDIFTDKDLRNCLRPIWNWEAKPVASACDKFWDTWMNSGKILGYSPALVSMLGSTAIAAGLQTHILSHALKPLHRWHTTVTIRGADLVHKSRVGKFLLEKGWKKLPNGFVMVGSFLLFLGIDMYITAEPSQRAWNYSKANFVDLNAASIKYLGLHSEYLWLKPGAIQPIHDAFTTEATNASGSHKYLMEFYKKMQSNGWKKPHSLESCLPADRKASIESINKYLNKQLFAIRYLGYWTLTRKTQSQLWCEVMARPGDLINAYAKTNREWRESIMSAFMMSQDNWGKMFNQFNTTYQAAMALGNHLTDEKTKREVGGETKPVDLSRETLAKVISSPILKEEEIDYDNPPPDKVHGAFLDNTIMPTPELVDYVVAGFACGADSKLDNSNRTWVPNLFNRVYSLIRRNVDSPTFMTTKWGSSLRFIPPKLTNKSRAICENVQVSSFDVVNTVAGGWLPTMRDKTKRNAFTGPFTDENRVQYATLADFVYENLDQETYRPLPGSVHSTFPTWWNQTFTEAIRPVWANYATTYESFIKNQMMPKLFDRTFQGCNVNRTTWWGFQYSDQTLDQDGMRVEGASEPTSMCSDPGTAYRVGNGYFLSLEIELRNYFRGLYSLYLATLKPEEATDAAKAAFMDNANQIVAAFNVMASDEFRAPDIGKKLDTVDADITKLMELVENRIKTAGGADAEFRAEMLRKFKESVAKLVTYQRDQVDLVNGARFGSKRNAPNGGSDKSVNSPRSLNPFMRN